MKHHFVAAHGLSHIVDFIIFIATVVTLSVWNSTFYVYYAARQGKGAPHLVTGAYHGVDGGSCKYSPRLDPSSRSTALAWEKIRRTLSRLLKLQYAKLQNGHSVVPSTR
ncbi:hypothetical protein BDV98DRAFT_59538 [Pterulicium gracile]|uniref:Uncharacterized protein n=1 Tax=Pterulicium gracile TaxID=1884261 RepID=A0A5C3QID6_9AGAR|nr:hypothetical protein BDV98DRAFT_59538 [Pterula gracilis]